MGFGKDCCSKRHQDFRDKCRRRDRSDIVICVDGNCFSMDSHDFKRDCCNKKRFSDHKDFTWGDWSW